MGLPIDINIGVDQEARNSIDALRKTLGESLIALADAIPGGRYTRLIEDLHGGNVEKKAAAQAFLKSLAGLDPQIDYQVTVWYDFDQTKKLHALIFRGELPTPDEIETRYTQASITNAFEVSRTPLRAPTSNEVRDAIRTALTRALEKLPFASLGSNEYINPLAERALMVDDLLEAFDAFSQHWTTPLETTLQAMDWPLFDERQTLFVLIPEEDWQEHGGAISVKAALHKSGDPKKPLPGAQLVSFETDEWRLIRLEDPLRPPRQFRWAVHTMTDTFLLSSSTAERVRAVRDALQQWEQLQPAKNVMP